ncbi:hypothetical protein [Nocardia sp. NBC_00403]|uniref:hypothetical protein n=1 Tax=Nocardia sp. NBC_00403 TaxID=2975990 RepID=UPI002E20773D
MLASTVPVAIVLAAVTSPAVAAESTAGEAMPIVLLSAAAASATGAPAVITDQPGVTSPLQPGTSTPTPPPDPAPTPPVYYVQPPEIRHGSGTRPAPSADQPVEPIAIEDLHLPVPVEPVAPIEPPENTIRVGQWEALRPDWLPPPPRVRGRDQRHRGRR